MLRYWLVRSFVEYGNAGPTPLCAVSVTGNAVILMFAKTYIDADATRIYTISSLLRLPTSISLARTATTLPRITGTPNMILSLLRDSQVIHDDPEGIILIPRNMTSNNNLLPSYAAYEITTAAVTRSHSCLFTLLFTTLPRYICPAICHGAPFLAVKCMAQRQSSESVPFRDSIDFDVAICSCPFRTEHAPAF